MKKIQFFNGILILMFAFSFPCFSAELKVLVTGLGSGTVTSSPAGIDCGVDCEETYSDSATVTLTATEGVGSSFAGWDVDVNTDSSTTPDCSGNSNTCSLPMSQARSVRPMFDLTPAIPTMTDFTPTGIETFFASNPLVNNAARFIKALPREYKQNWILMTRSESLQTGTAKYPRILLSNNDATSVFTIGLVSSDSYPGSHPGAIEYMQWDPAENNFRFHEVVLFNISALDHDGDGIGVIPARLRGMHADEGRCAQCHSTQNVLNTGTADGTEPGLVKFKNKPNWDTYDSWGGMTPFNRDRIFQGSVEAAAFRKLFNPWSWQSEPFVRSVMEQLELQPPGVQSGDMITRIAGGANDGHINFAFDTSPPVLTEPPPSGSGSISTNYSFNGTAGIGSGTTVTQTSNTNLFVRLKHALTPTSDEGRGVQLFDILGGGDGLNTGTGRMPLNARRIADEIISHRYATGGTMRVDVRPIALAITKGSCLNINSSGQVASSISSNPLAIDLSFFDARHGMDINDLVADTRARAESMPIRKADAQRFNLSRAGDVYIGEDASGTPLPEKGLIQEYGVSTTADISATLERLRQEVFRRNTAGFNTDNTAMDGIHVDREVYGSSVTRTALYRYFLEPLGVSVDKWSMGVRGRSRTYSFADVFGAYLGTFQPMLIESLTSDPISGLTNPDDCGQLITAINSTLSSLPDVGDIPKYTDVQRIFNKSCIECHGGLDYPPYSNYGSVLDFSENENPAPGEDRLDRAHDIVTTNFMAANAESSYLYDRITDYHVLNDPGNANSALQNKTVIYSEAAVNEDCPYGIMPCQGPPLSQTDILTIKRWIDGGSANTRGDPHIKTIDGTSYDFQAAGEFTLLKGQSFEVQTRQIPVATNSALGPNRHTGLTSCVSLNNAVAIKIGKHRITYQPDPNGQSEKNRLQLRIDGKLQQLTNNGIALSSGARVTRINDDGSIQVRSPGGSDIVITPRFWDRYQIWHMNIDARNVRATDGIMGAIAKGNWLPALADGSLLGARPDSLSERYKELYSTFGSSWRVKNATSLFDYASGTSTDTFTVNDWPKGESPNDCALPVQDNMPTIPPAEMLGIEGAQKHCEGLVDAVTKNNCIQDVRVTGEPDFAKAYLISESIERNVFPTAPVLISPKNNAEDVSLPIDFVWGKATDADEDDGLTYRHCVWPNDANFNINECEEISTTTLLGDLSLLHWVVLLGLFLVLLIVGIRKKSLWIILLAIIVLLIAIFAYNSDGQNTVSKTITTAEPGKIYYWKVIVEDSNGGFTESRVRRFIVR